MKWSWDVGKIAGINLKIHSTFVFLLIWIGFTTLLNGGSVSAMLSEMLFILALFLCVVLHELGHALAAKRYGVATRDITLLPIGGVARLESMPEDPKEELVVAAAGPAVNVLISGVLLAGILFSGVLVQPLELSGLLNNFWLRLLTVNIILVAFNMIPAFPMDGGRVLRAILASRMEYVKATRVAANIGRGFALLMGIAGFFWNPWLILTAIFIWSGAGSEAQAVETKAGLEGLLVRDAMVSRFYQVEANQTLSDVFQMILETGQKHIPVLSNGNFLGFIRHQDLLEAMRRLGDRAPAYAAIGMETEGVDPEMPVFKVLAKFTTSRVLPVTDGRALIGLITPESVQQRIWLNKQMKSVDSPPPEEKTDLA